MAMNPDQVQAMTQIIAETLRQIHEVRTVPEGPSLGSAGVSVKDLLKEIVTQMRGDGGRGGGRGLGRTILDERNFKRLDKFSSKEAEWESWQANVEVAVAAAHWPTAKVLEEVAVKEAMNEDILKDIFADIAVEKGWDDDAFMGEMEKVGGELYQHLCLLTVGETNTIVRSVREKNGFFAWQKLLVKFAPRTTARRLQAIMGIMKPPPRRRM